MLEECAALLMRGSQEGEDQSAHSAAVVSVTEVSLVLQSLRCSAGTSSSNAHEHWALL